jgi:hypothetical protein
MLISNGQQCGILNPRFIYSTLSDTLVTLLKYFPKNIPNDFSCPWAFKTITDAASDVIF